MSLAYGEVQRVPIGTTILGGLVAPWLHIRGLVTCSLLWIVAEFFYQLEVQQSRVWGIDSDGDVKWDYDFSFYGFALYVAQAYGLGIFILGWSRGLYFRNPAEFRLWRYERRMWWLLRDTLKLWLGLGLLAIPFFLVFWLATGMMGRMGTFGEVLGGGLLLGILVGMIAIACRLATFFTAIAVDEEPRSLIDAPEHTKGHAFRLFLILVPFVMLKSMVDTVLFGSAWLKIWGKIPGLPLFRLDIPRQVAPSWVIGLDTLVGWIYLACLLAAIAAVYRRITPYPPKDEETIGLF